MVNLFRYFRWLSLDIALGGAILVSFVGKQFHLEVSFFIQSAVFIAIWMIYTVDHLRDAKNLDNPSMDRHRFHKRNFKSIIKALGVMACFGIANLFFLPHRILLFGAVTVLIIIIYFIIQRRLSFIGFKEVVIALVYSASMFLYPYALLHFEKMDWLMFTELAVIALANLWLISLMEADLDRQDGTSTILSITSKKSLRVILFVLLPGVIGIAVTLLMIEYQPYQLFIWLAGSVLLAINSFPTFFARQERYRWIGDAIFFIPLFL